MGRHSVKWAGVGIDERHLPITFGKCDDQLPANRITEAGLHDLAGAGEVERILITFNAEHRDYDVLAKILEGPKATKDGEKKGK